MPPLAAIAFFGARLWKGQCGRLQRPLARAYACVRRLSEFIALVFGSFHDWSAAPGGRQAQSAHNALPNPFSCKTRF